MVRRLRWWQSIAGNPTHHSHYLSIFFGEYLFEQRARAAGNEVADVTILPNGELNSSAKVHPWALQFFQDLQ
eukprot:265030-Pyramimonas_sp.AAC.1